MNRSYSKIRHIQKLNMILENRVLNEQTEPTPPTPNQGGQSQPGPVGQAEPRPGDLPSCDQTMRGDGNPGSGTSAEGPFDKITSNGSVSPEYQKYILYKEGRPFCFIKRS
jgi:hypothetical protein